MENDLRKLSLVLSFCVLGLVVTVFVLVSGRFPGKSHFVKQFYAQKDNLVQQPTPTKKIDNYIPEEKKPIFSGDLAWGKPAFATSYWQDGYASNVTQGLGPWRSAESTGALFYVDLGKFKTFRRIVTTLFVDANFSQSPTTTYVASKDAQTWRDVYKEVNSFNSEGRGQYRILDLKYPVTARYVGLRGTDWSGGWADLTTFAVLP